MQLPLAVLGAGTKQQSALFKYDDDFTKAMKVIQDSVIQNTNPSHPVGVIAQNMPGTFGCSGCDYREVCLDEMNNYDGGNGHITLLARVTPALVAAKIPAISSIGQAHQLPGQDKFEIETKVRAEVWISGIPQLLDRTVPFDLPAFDIEIDIDLENSQEALLEIEVDDSELVGEDRLYLYGYGIHDRTKSKDWTIATILSNSDYSNTPEGEYALMLKTWSLLIEEVQKAQAKGLTIGIFHYSAHERTWWRRFAQRYHSNPGVPSLDEVERFVDRYFVDLYDYTRKISFPTTGYSIKLLAKMADFSWSATDPGGANSLLKYKVAIDKQATQGERDEAIAWLRSYNEDDVRATFAVRNYLRQLFPTESM
jgi:predicted RecB family nuclease